MYPYVSTLCREQLQLHSESRRMFHVQEHLIDRRDKIVRQQWVERQFYHDLCVSTMSTTVLIKDNPLNALSSLTSTDKLPNAVQNVVKCVVSMSPSLPWDDVLYFSLSLLLLCCRHRLPLQQSSYRTCSARSLSTVFSLSPCHRSCMCTCRAASLPSSWCLYEDLRRNAYHTCQQYRPSLFS